MTPPHGNPFGQPPLSERWLHSQDPTDLPAPLRWLRSAASAAASPLWASVHAARRSLYARNWLPQAAAPCPVVSVGGLTVGGAGKTEVVLWLARDLQRQHKSVLIVSRGYGRRASPQIPVIVTPDASWQDVGDEPLMMARALGVCVVVGADRAAAISFAWRAAGPFDVVLLDDGFQHLRLQRDLDILVVPPDVDTLRVLPAGPLREPLSTLTHLPPPPKSLLWVHAGDGRLPDASRLIAGRRPDITSRYTLTGLTPPLPSARLSCILLTAVGRNPNVARLLSAHGVPIAHHIALPDHDPLTTAAQRLQQLPNSLPILTTHKDWPKLQAALPPDLLARVHRIDISLDLTASPLLNTALARL